MKLNYILLIEDNPDDILLTKRAFMKNNIKNQIVVVEDGQDAIDFVEGKHCLPGVNEGELPQLILLDLKLPKKSGVEVLQHIRDKDDYDHIPVVVLTTSKEEDDMVDCYKSGANSFIRKPIELKDFIDVVNKLSVYWLIINETLNR